MIFGSAYHEGFESVLAGDAAEEGPELGLHLRRDQIASVFGGEDAMDEFRDIGVGHGRLRGESSAVPSGTEFQHPLSYPALKRRAIVRRPPDAFSFPERSAGCSSSSCHRSCYNEGGGGNSSTGRAPDCGSDGCGFDSRFPPQNSPASPPAAVLERLPLGFARGFGKTGQALEAAAPTQSRLLSHIYNRRCGVLISRRKSL